jgi:hypothetical protein
MSRDEYRAMARQTQEQLILDAGLPLTAEYPFWPLVYDPKSLSYVNGTFSGIVWNAGPSTVEAVTVHVRFTDPRGVLVGESIDFTRSIRPKEQWRFSVSDIFSSGYPNKAALSDITSMTRSLGDPRK